MKFMIPLVLALVFSSAAEGYFRHAIGVQDPSIIPDNQMTASSYYSSAYYPYFGRLHDIRGRGWAGRTRSNLSDWLQVDFGRIALVCAVATQGNPSLNEWVIDFSLSFSSDGASWMHSSDLQGNKMVFTRLGNNSYVDQQTLPAPMSARYIRFHPISQHNWNTLRVEVYEAFSPVTTSAPGYFRHAIGVQDPSIIPDNQMTASSYYSSAYYPYFGRLHDIRGRGWAGRTRSNLSDWLQVDFGRIALVCAVATQGNPSLNEWVIDFSLSFSSDGASWMHSSDLQGNKMVFTRLGNNSYVDQQTLPAPMSARYIRFHPISQHNWNTLRVEVYEAFSPVTTSAPGYFHHAIGVQDPSIIPDNQMTASSYYSSLYYPYFGRLHNIRGGGWAGRTPSNPSDWLQVDFGRIALVCAVATQGNPYLNEWVIDFSLSFSSDGASWMHSSDLQGNKMVFTRLGNNSYVDQQTLPAPMSARYIRFHPISQHSWNTLRVEVYEAFSPVTTSAPGPPAPVTCGVSPMTRVIGGVDAKPGNWPWQIALLRGGRFICGGSLIAPDWIVTAAHCVASSQPPCSYSIRVGDHNRQLNEGTEETVQGKEIISHPEYNKPSLINNDIALIRLVRPVKLGPRVGTVCLPAQGESVPVSATCYITGWGKIKHPGSAHNILQQAKLPPVSNEVCARKLAQSPGGDRLNITDKMICAGIEGEPLSGCHGDSGGPYVCQSSSGNWFLQGAVSWGSPRCAASERYSVFARVAQFRNWIRQHTGV
ncbi:uncharacterized protein [Acropora muricata]|uniref:uncharacterized protein isoform X2 n=1 Tax=Acropora muricata TaxID=159855 RepID=UPI0034E39397